jgi:hypothetical protein
LKFEPGADQRLKGTDHQPNSQDELCLVGFLAVSICDIAISSSANRSAGRFGEGRSNLKVFPLRDL